MNSKVDDAQPFDLYLAGNIVHELSSFLTKITDQCGQKYEARLAQMLQSDISVSTHLEVIKTSLQANHDEHKYRSWITVNGNTQNYGAIALDRELCSICLDLLCGGKGTPTKKAGREGPVAGERRVLLRLIKSLFESFAESMEAIMPFNMALTTKSEDAQATRIHRNERDFVVYIAFAITAGSHTGLYEVFLPASVLAATDVGNRRNNKSQMKNDMAQALQQVPLPVTAVIGQQQTTLKKVLNIQPGDILPLSEPINADVFVSNKLFCNAAIVSDNSRLMLKINQQEESDQDDQQEYTPDTNSEGETVDENEIKSSRSARAEARRKARQQAKTTTEPATKKRNNRSEGRVAARNRTTARGEHDSKS